MSGAQQDPETRMVHGSALALYRAVHQVQAEGLTLLSVVRRPDGVWLVRVGPPPDVLPGAAPTLRRRPCPQDVGDAAASELMSAGRQDD